MIVTKILDLVDVNSTTNGSSFTFEMPKSNRGIVTFEMGNNTVGLNPNVTLELQGRLSDAMDFVPVFLTDSDTQATLTPNTDIKTFEDIQMFPQMRACLVGLNNVAQTDVTVTIST